ncbi:MAG: alpha-amylase family protein [Armatimonadota bacterium]
MNKTACRVETDVDSLTIVSPFFTFNLSKEDQLSARWLENKITGHQIDLGNGSEFGLEIDQSEKRIPITGWRSIIIDPSNPESASSVDNHTHPDFDDRAWTGTVTPATDTMHIDDPLIFDKHIYARTHIFLPVADRDKVMTLILGGVGLYDYTEIAVRINGKALGTRLAPERWSEPGRFDLSPGSDIYEHLKFGQDNIIAIRCAGYKVRPDRLNKLDKAGGRSIDRKCQWPAQFEQYVVVNEKIMCPSFKIDETIIKREGDNGEVVFNLKDTAGEFGAEVSYSWDAEIPILHKSVRVINQSNQNHLITRLNLGGYETASSVSDGEQGFPVYFDDMCFMSLTHPAGWAKGHSGHAELSQYPGKLLEPGAGFTSMECIYGVCDTGQTHKAFTDYVKSRCRRVLRGHDKAYSIYDFFGIEVGENATEERTLRNLNDVKTFIDNTGCVFDIYSLDFWVDHSGDLIRADRDNFPNGLDSSIKGIKDLGMAPGMWIDSSWEAWSIGQNPVVRPDINYDPAYGGDLPSLCRAVDPIHTMYSTAFRHHIRENSVRMIKFDNLQAICYNPCHCHLPGIYSTEAIFDGVIEALKSFDEECPDVFLMLYWGYHSPWWLQYADTLFEPGTYMEASHPTINPTLYSRDSVTVGLDQAQYYCEDIPSIGKDSLGVWFSTWVWNCGIGKERWQEAFVMDMCRGSLLAQPWSDIDLTVDDQKQMAEFITLLKENPECFGNPRFIVGNPWNLEPYGYCCTNGKRAFIALNNPTWMDADITLQLNSNWGLPDGVDWSIYRWYPEPAQISTMDISGDGSMSIALRPLDVVLLEVIPEDDAPSLGREFKLVSVPSNFTEASGSLDLDVRKVDDPGIWTDMDEKRLNLPMLWCGEDTEAMANMEISDNLSVQNPKQSFTITSVIIPVKGESIIAISAEAMKNSAPCKYDNIGKRFVVRAELDGEPVELTPAFSYRTHPLNWQLWRIKAGSCDQPRKLQLTVTCAYPDDVVFEWNGHLVIDERY